MNLLPTLADLQHWLTFTASFLAVVTVIVGEIYVLVQLDRKLTGGREW